MARISFITFGCRVNQYETEEAIRKARQEGHEVVEWGQPADIQVVHTCSVTNAAVRDGRQALRQAARQNPNSRIVATGCAVRTEAGKLDPGISGVELTGDLPSSIMLEAEQQGLEEALSTAVPLAPGSRQTRVRALLKIHDGCFFSCAFCIVPQARPVESSKPVEEALEEARAYVALGHKEIVLTGVRITGYRPSRYGRGGLVELIRRMGDIPGLARVRLTSLYPSEVKEELLRAISETGNACPHLHLAIQSGDDSTLKRMNRRYSVQQLFEVSDMARTLIPDVSITSDIICGFPGETEEEFQNTMQTVRKLGFSRAHVFTWSERPGTSAQSLPNRVPQDIARKRTKELIEVVSQTASAYRQRFVGQSLPVILEQQKRPGVLTGMTAHYVEVETEGNEHLKGKSAKVSISGLSRNGLKGRILEVLDG